MREKIAEIINKVVKVTSFDSRYAVLHDVNKAANQVLKYQIEEIKKLENPYQLPSIRQIAPGTIYVDADMTRSNCFEACREAILKALEEK